MAVLNVSVYYGLGRGADGQIMDAAQEPSRGRGNITFSATAANGAPFDSGDAIIRITSDTNCWFRIGVDAVAVAADNSSYLPANVVEYFGVTKGTRISVVQA